jgi:hypothetical protein
MREEWSCIRKRSQLSPEILAVGENRGKDTDNMVVQSREREGHARLAGRRIVGRERSKVQGPGGNGGVSEKKESSRMISERGGVNPNPVTMQEPFGRSRSQP